MTLGVAFSRAYLPARRIALDAQKKLLAGATPKSDARRLVWAISAKASEADGSLAKLPPDPPSSPVLERVHEAGMTARRAAIAAELLALLAQLRFEAPNDDSLRAQAAEFARELREQAALLTKHLKATGIPLVLAKADSIERRVSRALTLEPIGRGGFDQLRVLVNDIHRSLETASRDLDAPLPPQAISGPTPDEVALLGRIIADPCDLALRTLFAELAARRKDPRAELIRLQLAGETGSTLILTHPEWTAPLEQLGAREIQFVLGFPDEIHVDADSLLANGNALFAAAPITRVHVRHARGRVAAIVRSPLLAQLEALDLDDAGVTDDDVEVLASSPASSRLRQLDLRFNPLTLRGIEAIAASPFLARLEIATFDGNPADPTDRQVYSSETSYDYVPTEAGKALEHKYGPLRWLHRR